MKKINTKQKLTNYIFSTKLKEKKNDFIISTTKVNTLKKIDKYQGSKLTFINYYKNLFKDAKFPLQVNSLKNKIELKSFSKTLKPKIIIINQFVIKEEKVIQNFKYLNLNIFANLSLITNNLKIITTS